MRSSFACVLPLLLVAGCGEADPPSRVGETKTDPTITKVEDPTTEDTKGGARALGSAASDRIADALAGRAVDVPFTSSFARVGPVRCTSLGIDKISATFEGDSYQFSSCSLVVSRGDDVRGDVSVAALGTTPADPWVVTTRPVAGDARALEIGFWHSQPSSTSFDWQTRPLTLRFAYATPSGRRAVSEHVLAPAAQSEIIAFGAPRVPAARTKIVDVDGRAIAEERVVRTDASGMPVFRADEELVFEVPFTLPPNVDADYVAGTLVAYPAEAFDGDACLFDDLFPSHDPAVFGQARKLGWDDGEGHFALVAVGASSRPLACASRRPAIDRVRGRVVFDPQMGPSVHASDFAVRVARGSVAADVTLKPAQGDDGELVGLEVTNVADYALEPLDVALRFVCAAEDARAIRGALTSKPETDERSGRAIYRTIDRGATTKWTRDEIRLALKDAIARTHAPCSARRWNVVGAEVIEDGRANHSPMVELGAAFVSD